LSLLLSVENGDSLLVGETTYTVLTAPLRLAAPDTKTMSLNEDETPLSADVSVSVFDTSIKSRITLRVSAPSHITVTRIPGGANQ